jgi:serine/threonine protein kinase
VVYEMVTGRAPFDGATPGEVMAAIWNQEPLPLRRHARDAPAELERIVDKALQKDCEERYQVIKDLLLDLKSLKLELEVEVKLKRAVSPEAVEEIGQIAQPPTPASLNATHPSDSSGSAPRRGREPVGGAVPLDSEFYIVRPADEEFRAAIARGDSIVLVKGA